MPETPLGRIVSIRAEKDKNVIKNFSKEEKRIRAEWQMKLAEKRKKDTKAYTDYWTRMQNELKNAFMVK